MQRYMWPPDAEENKPIMVEDNDGAWVKWDDVKDVIGDSCIETKFIDLTSHTNKLSHPYVFAPKLHITEQQLAIILTHMGLRMSEVTYEKLPSSVAQHFVKD